MINHPVKDEELSISTSANASCWRCMNPTGLQDEDLTNNLDRPQFACMCRFQQSAAEMQDDELSVSANPSRPVPCYCMRNNAAEFQDEDLAMNVEAQQKCFFCRRSPAELQDEDLAMNATQMHCGACFCTHTQVKVQDEDLSINLGPKYCVQCFSSRLEDEELASVPELQLIQCYRCASPISADLPAD